MEKGLAYLQQCSQSENVVSTLVQTIRSLLVAFPKTASEDLAQLTSTGRVDSEFSKSTKELIALTETILAKYKEVDEEEEEGEEEEKGEEKKEEGEKEEKGEDNDNESDNEEMKEEVSEDMTNILEYRLGQMLILMNAIKFAHFAVEKKRKHSEI